MATPDILTNQTFHEGMEAIKTAIEKGIGNSDLFQKVGDEEIIFGDGTISNGVNKLYTITGGLRFFTIEDPERRLPDALLNIINQMNGWDYPSGATYSGYIACKTPDGNSTDTFYINGLHTWNKYDRGFIKGWDTEYSFICQGGETITITSLTNRIEDGDLNTISIIKNGIVVEKSSGASFLTKNWHVCNVQLDLKFTNTNITGWEKLLTLPEGFRPTKRIGAKPVYSPNAYLSDMWYLNPDGSLLMINSAEIVSTEVILNFMFIN